MNTSNITRKIIFKTISIVLVHAFILLDVALAGGMNLVANKQADTLSAPIEISQQMFNENFGKIYEFKLGKTSLSKIAKQKISSSKTELYKAENTEGRAVWSSFKQVISSKYFWGALVGFSVFVDGGLIIGKFSTMATVISAAAVSTILATSISTSTRRFLASVLSLAIFSSFTGCAAVKKGDYEASINQSSVLQKSDYEASIYVSTLRRFGDARDLTVLIKIMEDSKSYEHLSTFKAVAQELGKIKDARAVPPLIRALENKSSNIRIIAAQVLGELGEFNDARSVLSLIEALDDFNSDLQEASYKALEKIVNTRDVPVLIRMLRDKNGNNYKRISMAKLLGKIKDVRAVPQLLKALEDENFNLHEYADKALSEIKDTNAVPLLIKALESENLNVRATAARVLGEFKDARAVPALIKLLGDKYQVREFATEALIKIKDARAVPTLIKALEDKNPNVRANAARVLGEIKDARAIPALIKTLKDLNSFVMQDAEDALDKIKNKEKSDTSKAGSTIIQQITDKSKGVKTLIPNVQTALQYQLINQAI